MIQNSKSDVEVNVSPRARVCLLSFHTIAHASVQLKKAKMWSVKCLFIAFGSFHCIQLKAEGLFISQSVDHACPNV